MSPINNTPWRKKKTITPSNLSQTPAIIPHKNTATGQVIHEYFMQQNLGIKQAPQVPSSANFILIKTLITLGLGWGVLPQHMLDSSFKKLPLKAAKLTRKLGVIYHNKRKLSPAAKAFISLCQKNHY